MLALLVVEGRAEDKYDVRIVGTIDHNLTLTTIQDLHNNTNKKEINVLIKRALARKISKHLGGCGFVTHVQEVSSVKIGEVDHFRIVIYHEDFKDYICKQTGYDVSQFEDKKSI